MTITTPTNSALFGSGDRLSIAHDPALSPDSWTIEAWISTTDADGDFNRIIRQAVGGLQTYSLLVKDGQAHVRFDPGAVVQAGPNIADGELHHLVGVFDNEANQLILYVDGLEVGRSTETGNPVQGTEPLEIGTISAAANQFFDGVIHEVRVWSDVRTHLEILEAAEGVIPANEPNLELQLTFPDGVPEDQSTNAFQVSTTGTLEPATALVVDDDVFTPIAGISVDLGDPAAGVDVELTVSNLDLDLDDPGPGVSVTEFNILGAAGFRLQGPEDGVNQVLATLSVQPQSAGGASLKIEASVQGAMQLAVVQTIAINGALDPEAASLVVTTLDDVVDPTDGLTSLREALALTNQNGDALGDGLPDEITFAENLQGGTLFLDGGTLEITDDVSIRGDIEINGLASVEVMRIIGGSVELQDLSLQDGLTTSPNSAGAPLVRAGNLFIAAEASVELRDVSIKFGYFGYGAGGGGISNAGSLSIIGGEIEGNFSRYGVAAGAIYSTGSLLIDGVEFLANEALEYGTGAIVQRGSHLTISNTSFNFNVSGSPGYNGGGPGPSGAISLINGASANISNTLFSDNSGYGQRTGALHVSEDSAATVVNTTFHGNYSESGTASVFNRNGTLSLTHVTVTGGVGGETGGVRSFANYAGAETRIQSSILLGNTDDTGSQTDLLGSGLVNQQGLNIIGDRLFNGSVILDENIQISDVFTGSSNNVGALADNGGPTQTVLLRPGGVAHNVSSATPPPDSTDADGDGNTTEALPADARGGVRFVGIGFDLGAVELSLPTEGNDIVFSTINNRTAVGLGGDDTVLGSGTGEFLEGGDGDDTLIGGEGDDVLEGGADNDILDGGDGVDTADYTNATSETLVVLFNRDGIAQQTFSSGRDVLIGIENITGSAFDDRLFGDENDNTIRGGDLDDTIDGVGGNDRHFGGNGNDGFRARGGADLFDGGADTDFVNYDASAGVNAFLDGSGTNGRAAVGDTFVGIENLVGSLIGGDLLFGNEFANRLTGNGGDDTLRGRAGIDQFEGGEGADTLIGDEGADVYVTGAGADTIIFNQAPNAAERDRITDFTSGEDILQIDVSVFGGGLVAGGTAQLVANGNPVADAAGGTFLYDTDNGTLRFDADGNGAGGAVLFAFLQNVPTLLASDFDFIA